MSQVRNFITLDSVINDYIDASEQSIHKYAKLYNIAYRGMEQMGLDFFYKIKSVKIPVNANKTVSLPSDILQYTKIGVLNSRGEIIPLKFNNKLTYFADQLPDRAAKTQDDTLQNIYVQDSPIFYNYWDGNGFTNVYGIPSGSPFVGNFNVDIANGVILFNENFYYDYVMIEYISAPDSQEQYMIPIQFREAIIAWLSWQDIAYMPNSRRGTLGDKRDRKNNFFNERRLANARFRPLYLNDAYELNLESQRLTVKA